MTADECYLQIHGMLKFMRDMYDPRFMPPFVTMDAERAVAPSPLRPNFQEEEE